MRRRPSPGAAIAALLARLVEQSLVQPRNDRFTLLETLRAFATERLAAAGQRDRLRAVHARDTADAARRVSKPALDRAGAAPPSAHWTELVADLHAAWQHAATHDQAAGVCG